jgi:hypothetical protein
MAKSMSRSTPDEPLEKIRGRYRRDTGKPAKSRLLDEFCELTGHERKDATRRLGGRLEAWSLWRNAFTTPFKQTERKRVGSKTRRRHEKEPKTPFQRLIPNPINPWTIGCFDLGNLRALRPPRR